ncbi:MAG: hypothetical protein ACKVQC_02725, partial [Elusimicrobiota bacterium]
LLVGSRDEWTIDYKEVEQKFLTNSEMKKDLAPLKYDHPFSFLATSFVLDDADFREYSKNGKLNTDNKPLLEFSAPRYLHRGQQNLIQENLFKARQRNLPKNLINLNSTPKEQALLFNIAGESFLRHQAVGPAENYFAEAFKLEPKNPRTLINIARILNLYNKHLQAEGFARKAIDIDPRYALGWFHLGMLYLEQGIDYKGIEALKKGLELAPGDPMGTLQLAQIYLKEGSLNNALKIINHSLRKRRSNSSIYITLENLKREIELRLK